MDGKLEKGLSVQDGENPFASSGRRRIRAYFEPGRPAHMNANLSKEFSKELSKQFSKESVKLSSSSSIKGSVKEGRKIPWRWLLGKSKYVATEVFRAFRNPVPVEFNARDDFPTMMWPDSGKFPETRKMVDRASSPLRESPGLAARAAEVSPEDLLQLMAYPVPSSRRYREKPRNRSRAVPSPIMEDEQELPPSDYMRYKISDISAAISAGDRRKLIQLASTKLGLVNSSLRREAWAIILHAEKNHDKRSKVFSHKSDRQIEKECTSAFAIFPKKLTDTKRQRKQSELTQLLKAIFQREPQLAYFQGFRDIAGCFLLVMGRRRVANALQNAALFYFRDIMLGSLTSVLREMELGMRIVSREDPELARFLTEAGVQPYYGIAWVLSWASRCVHTLAIAARIFDAFLSNHPTFPVYLITALTLSRRKEILKLPKEKTSINAALSRFPPGADIEKLLASASDLHKRHSPEQAFSTWRAELGPNTCTQRYGEDWVSIRSEKDYQISYARVQGYINQARQTKHHARQPVSRKSSQVKPKEEIPKEPIEEPVKGSTVSPSAVETPSEPTTKEPIVKNPPAVPQSRTRKWLLLAFVIITSLTAIALITSPSVVSNFISRASIDTYLRGPLHMICKLLWSLIAYLWSEARAYIGCKISPT